MTDFVELMSALSDAGETTRSRDPHREVWADTNVTPTDTKVQWTAGIVPSILRLAGRSILEGFADCG